MCPTAFLAPTLTAKTCFICTQPQNAFFLAQLAVQDNRANGQKSFPGHVPGPKKRTKMVPKSGPFQKEFFCSAAKKSPKNWTGPWLSLNMVNGNTFSKWQTPLRNAKCWFQGANPTPPSPIQPCGDRQPERRSNRNVYCGGPPNLMVKKTVLPRPQNLNPICSSKCIALAPHAKVLRTIMQY